jgi:isomerase DpgB
MVGGVQSVFNLDLTGETKLPNLTVKVDAFCADVEQHGREAALVVVHPDHDFAETPWPGAVDIQDASRWERAIRRLERLSAIIITAARGCCGGAATDVFLISDFRVVTRDFSLRLPINHGQFWPGMSLYRLVHQVGIARARQIVLWGRTLDATQCLQAGLVDEVVHELDSALADLLPRIGRQPAGEVGIRRRLLLEAISSPYEDALGAHLAAADRELRRIESFSQRGDPTDHEPLR